MLQLEQPSPEAPLLNCEEVRQSVDEPNPLKGFYEIYGSGLNALGIRSSNQ